MTFALHQFCSTFKQKQGKLIRKNTWKHYLDLVSFIISKIQNSWDYLFFLFSEQSEMCEPSGAKNYLSESLSKNLKVEWASTYDIKTTQKHKLKNESKLKKEKKILM